MLTDAQWQYQIGAIRLSADFMKFPYQFIAQDFIAWRSAVMRPVARPWLLISKQKFRMFQPQVIHTHSLHGRAIFLAAAFVVQN